MYNVLIADDEPKVCKGLRSIIDWGKYGYNVIDTAEDGEDALEKLNKGRYNLVITDIRMPVLNGLELIKKIQAQNPDIKILIISGYSDFAYAKQAIEYGVKGYLLKPVNREDLIEHIVKLKDELDNELNNRKYIRENANIAIDKFLLDFVTGNLTENAINEKIKSVGISIRSDCYCIALIEIDSFNNLVEKNLEDANLLKFSIRNVVEEIVNEKQIGFVYEDTYGILGILFCGEKFISENNGNISAFLEYIQLNILTYIKTSVTIGYGSIVKSAYQVKDSRKQAQFALHKGILSDGNKIVCYVQENGLNGNHILKMKWDNQRLLSAIEMFDEKSIKTEINSFMDEVSHYRITKDIMQTMLYNFVFTICTAVRKYNGDAVGIFSQNEIYDLENYKLDYSRLKEWLLSKCIVTCEYLADLQKNKSSNIINQVKIYIDKNYSEDLSLKSIAGIFYLSPAYLGRLFKNGIGEAFNDYLNKVRISEVKKMVFTEDSKVYEIITKVGYNNHEHFYRQFKRYEGTSFAEFKETVRKI